MSEEIKYDKKGGYMKHQQVGALKPKLRFSLGLDFFLIKFPALDKFIILDIDGADSANYLCNLFGQ